MSFWVIAVVAPTNAVVAPVQAITFIATGTADPLVDDNRAWRNSEGYDLLRRGLGCTESGGIRLDAGNGSLHMIGFARQTNFSIDEIARLQVFRAPVLALTSHSEWLRAM